MGLMYKIQTGKDNPILRKRAETVIVFEEGLAQMLESMTETMLCPTEDADVRGIGLAANQVGLTERIILVTFNMEHRKNAKVVAMVNPEILGVSGHQVSMEEGCLSLPGQYAEVKRPAKVHARWQNVTGQWCEKKLTGWDARIFLHEYDHLEGKLFVDYL